MAYSNVNKGNPSNSASAWNWDPVSNKFKEPAGFARNKTNSGHSNYGCLPENYLEQITSTWFCSLEKCPRGFTPKHAQMDGLWEDLKDIRVLDCGHFICDTCANMHAEEVVCNVAHCGHISTVEHNRREFPLAQHTMVLRKELLRKGIPCCGEKCKKTNGKHRYFPHDTVYMCTNSECSDRLSSIVIYDLERSPGSAWMKSGPSGKCKIKTFCPTCAFDHIHRRDNASNTHKIVLIVKYSLLELTISEEYNSQSILKGRHRLSAFTSETTRILLRKYLACFCGNVYDNSTSVYPVLLNCSHVVCSACRNEIRDEGLQSIPYVTCLVCDDVYEMEGIRREKGDRKVSDLQFGRTRDPTRTKLCNSEKDSFLNFENYFVAEDVKGLAPLLHKANNSDLCVDCLLQAYCSLYPADKTNGRNRRSLLVNNLLPPN
ncbi:hypothetical protein PFISCL1PPCAC_16497 [Pristionchus fissidentatus]|uniref:RING-type domain-containing protein n=1 Tax=Pristionchus fissidentatus TaxID=1538716 RepID=A0AAV5W4D8_9BILA|nr:hypothetical protein PFISCL1PPCAC_16497 [Pristionchus fissidentatus]